MTFKYIHLNLSQIQIGINSHLYRLTLSKRLAGIQLYVFGYKNS